MHVSIVHVLLITPFLNGTYRL